MGGSISRRGTARVAIIRMRQPDQPENDVAVAPTGAAQRAQPVDHSGGQLNQVLAALGLGRIEAATGKKPN